MEKTKVKTPQEIEFDIIAARSRETVVCLDEEKSETTYCTLTPVQEAQKRQEWQALRIKVDSLAEEEARLKRAQKDARADYEVSRNLEHIMSGAFVQNPPQGHFMFVGDRYIDEYTQTTWLEDPSGKPIIETFRKMNAEEILKRSKQKEGQQLDLEFEDGDEESNDTELEAENDLENSDESADPDPELM